MRDLSNAENFIMRFPTRTALINPKLPPQDKHDHVIPCSIKKFPAELYLQQKLTNDLANPVYEAA